MHGLKLLAVLLAWYFLVSGEPTGFGGTRVYTQAGPFATQEQCDFIRKQITNYSFRSGCWSDGK